LIFTRAATDYCSAPIAEYNFTNITGTAAQKIKGYAYDEAPKDT
jgi:hypothetical protein